MSEQVIRLAAKLYEARDTMRRIYGERYQEQAAVARTAIQNYASANSCDALTAAIRMAKDSGSPFVTGMLLSAALDISDAEDVA